jgi:hypothetical protein
MFENNVVFNNFIYIRYQTIKCVFTSPDSIGYGIGKM